MAPETYQRKLTALPSAALKECSHLNYQIPRSGEMITSM